MTDDMRYNIILFMIDMLYTNIIYKTYIMHIHQIILVFGIFKYPCWIGYAKDGYTAHFNRGF